MIFFRVESEAQDSGNWSSLSYAGVTRAWQPKGAEAANRHLTNEYLLSTHYALENVLSI